MSPPEFLLRSLATCAGYYAAQYLKTRGLNSEGLEVIVIAQRTSQPARLSSFRVDVRLRTLDEQHETTVLRSVKACLIHNTLISGPRIEIAIHSDRLVAA
jgi:putative redox protein